MSWRFHNAVREFPRLSKDWDALNASTCNHVLLDSGFVGPLLRHFGNEDVLLAVDDSASTGGMLLLSPLGAGRWETFQPSQAPIGLVAFSHIDATGESLCELTRKLPGHALQLSVMQQDPDYSCFPLQTSEGRFERVDYIQTARITLSGTFEDYWKARGTNLRHNLARRRRRLAEKVRSCELVEIRSPAEVAAAIREFGRLESAGWKGREGTAVTEDNAQGRFYLEMLAYFCERREAVIYQLRFDGQVVASDLCVMRGGMIVVLKTAYDEAFNDYSPAFMMREEQLKKLYADSTMRVVEFYGRVMDWHTRWSEEIRTLYHINCLRHVWVEALKKFAGRLS